MTVPTVPDLSGALMKYAQMRPRDLNLFVNVLVCMFDAGEAVPVENLVGSLLPKMKLHAQSLELVHTLDLCQDDLAALLHLLMKVTSFFYTIAESLKYFLKIEVEHLTDSTFKKPFISNLSSLICVHRLYVNCGTKCVT